MLGQQQHNQETHGRSVKNFLTQPRTLWLLPLGIELKMRHDWLHAATRTRTNAIPSATPQRYVTWKLWNQLTESLQTNMKKIYKSRKSKMHNATVSDFGPVIKTTRIQWLQSSIIGHHRHWIRNVVSTTHVFTLIRLLKSRRPIRPRDHVTTLRGEIEMAAAAFSNIIRTAPEFFIGSAMNVFDFVNKAGKRLTHSPVYFFFIKCDSAEPRALRGFLTINGLHSNSEFH